MAAKGVYRFVKLSCVRDLPNEPFILMRHDVDISLESALRMAQIETEYGINTTYCIRLRSPFYNVHNDREFDIICQILKMGHEIGLHYDLSFYERRGLSVQCGIEAEVQTLQREFKTTITGLSQHDPVFNNVFRPDKEYICAYQKELISDLKYISDSGRSWRSGCICKHLPDFDRLHVLIHPEWWISDHNSWMEALLSLKEDSVDSLKNAFDVIIRRTADYLHQRRKLDSERESRY